MIACKCNERKKPADQRAWVYWDYKCNYSAFNGSRYTPSDYSVIHCNCCGATWRSKMTGPWPQSARGSRR